MQTYKNLGGNSGISAYEIFDDYIAIQFSDGSIYEYSKMSAGSDNIEQMKILACNGQGLNSFVMRKVRTKFSAKR